MSRVRGEAAAQLRELAATTADGARFSRGRAIARRGQVVGLLVGRGEVRADVRGSREEPYAVTLACRPASASVAQRFADAVAADALGARLLARGTVRPGLVDDAVAAGVPLVPAAGDVSFSCTCPDWGEPCKHGVAVLLELAAAVDDDGAVLLRWRGLEPTTTELPPPAPSGGERSASVTDLLARLPPGVRRGAPAPRPAPPAPTAPTVAPARPAPVEPPGDPELEAFLTGGVPAAGPVLGAAGAALAARAPVAPPFVPAGPFLVDGIDAALVLVDAVTAVAEVLEGLV